MKKLISLAIALTVILSALPVNAQTTKEMAFSDVSQNAWYYNYVKNAYNDGIVTGVDNEKFCPDENITVAQIITIAARIFEKKNNLPIGELENTVWYKKYTEYADKNALAPKHRFGYGYDELATRAEVCAVFKNLVTEDEVINPGITKVYDMADKSRLSALCANTDYEAILHLMRLGIIKGKDEYGSFYPDDYITRAEVAKMACLVVDKKQRESFLIKESEFVTKEYSAEEIYEKNAQAVFTILTYDKRGYAYSIGTGFFVDSSGLAVTNYHVIEEISGAQAYLADGRIMNVSGVVGISPKDDIALIALEGSGFKTVTLADSDTRKNGQEIYVIGSPLGVSGIITDGLISNISRKNGDSVMMQISASITAGNSGGPVILSDGTVVGVAAASYIDESVKHINFAVPLNYIYSLDEYKLRQFSSFIEKDVEVIPESEKQGYSENKQIPDFEYVTGHKPTKSYLNEDKTYISYGYKWNLQAFNRYIAYLINNKWTRSGYDYDDYTEHFTFEKGNNVVEVSKIGDYIVVSFKGL